MPETPEYPKAIDMEQSQQLSQPNTVDDRRSKVCPLVCCSVCSWRESGSPRIQRVSVAQSVSQRKNVGKSSAFEIYNENAEKVKTILPEKQTMEMIIYRLIYVSIHLFIPII